jgi:hypothetical protein
MAPELPENPDAVELESLGVVSEAMARLGLQCFFAQKPFKENTNDQSLCCI